MYTTWFTERCCCIKINRLILINFNFLSPFRFPYTDAHVCGDL